MDRSFPFLDVKNPTWLLYVALLITAVYFRFTRFFTIRNVDLVLLLLISTTSVLMIDYRDRPYEVTNLLQPHVISRPVSGVEVSEVPQTARSNEKSPADSIESRSETPAAGENETTTQAPTTQAPITPDADSVNATGEPPEEVSATGSIAALANAVSTAPESQSPESQATVAPAADSDSQTNGQDSPAEVVAKEIAQASLVLEPEKDKAAKHPVFIWSSMALLVLTALLLIRLIFDESLTRRPRLDQNLNQAALTFLCIPAFAILMVGAVQYEPTNSTVKAMEHGRALLQRRDVPVDPSGDNDIQPAPTETLIAAGGTAVAQLSGSLPRSADEDSADAAKVEKWIARVLVVVAHTIVVLGLLTIGRQHFASLQLGIAMSCLYLLLPCTAVNVHKLNHVLPAACLIWAIASYRKPVVSGILLGLASGTLFFAVFLLPLWAVFYGRKGGVRFVISVMGVAVVLVTALMMISGDASSLFNKLITTANWTVYRLLDDSVAVDNSLSQLFVRIPMAAVFFVMLTGMTVLPRPRNLENLLANSTCLVVAAQLWYPDDIGSYVLWYLPLFLLVIFRPRLDRFTPPEIVGRQAEPVLSEVPVGSASTVAMNRLGLFGK